MRKTNSFLGLRALRPGGEVEASARGLWALGQHQLKGGGERVMRNLRGVDLATAATAEKQNTKRCCHWIARAGLECCPGWEAAGPGVPFLEPRRAVGNRSSGPNSLRLEEAQNRALMCRFREHYLLGLRVGLCLQNLTSVSHTCYYLNSTSCDGL